MKLWKKILIVIGIIFAIFLLNTARKLIIFNQINKKASAYENLTNFHIKTYGYHGNNLMIVENYKKDNHYLMKINNLSPNGNVLIRNYDNEGTKTTYLDAPEAKTATVNVEEFLPTFLGMNMFREMSMWNKILIAINSPVKTAKCNGKICYEIHLNYATNVLYDGEDYVVYIDKETGLRVRDENGISVKENENINMLNDYFYEFNNVDDSVFVEPDITEYEVQENK